MSLCGPDTPFGSAQGRPGPTPLILISAHKSQSTAHSPPLTIHDQMRSNLQHLASVALLLLIPAFAHAQSYCAPIQSAKEKTYGFNPTKLENQARTEKSAQMDAFWRLVKSYEDDGVTCLRGLLISE